MFAKSKVSQSMIDAVNKVLGEKVEEQEVKQPEQVEQVTQLDEASPIKEPTATGMRVYGRSYGNSAKAKQDQTKSSVDDLKGPKDKEVKEELKGDQHKIDANKNGKVDGQDFEILRKKKVKEDMHFANKLLETVRKSDVPAYLRKAKGDTPLTVADVKAPKKDSISAPENLAKARNEEVVNEAKGIPVAHNYTMHLKHTGKYRVHSPSGEHVGDVEKEGNMWRYHGSSNPNWPGNESHKDYQTDKVENKHEAGDIVAHLHHSGMKNEELELDQQINEVLGKDASAGDWISDFVHSDNPKFDGKSKAERKKMALGAYYGKQDEATIAGTPGWKEMKKDVKDKSGAVHTPMSRARDLARAAFKKIQKEVK